MYLQIWNRCQARKFFFCALSKYSVSVRCSQQFCPLVFCFRQKISLYFHFCAAKSKNFSVAFFSLCKSRRYLKNKIKKHVTEQTRCWDTIGCPNVSANEISAKEVGFVHSVLSLLPLLVFVSTFVQKHQLVLFDAVPLVFWIFSETHQGFWIFTGGYRRVGADWSSSATPQWRKTPCVSSRWRFLTLEDLFLEICCWNKAGKLTGFNPGIGEKLCWMSIFFPNLVWLTHLKNITNLAFILASLTWVAENFQKELVFFQSKPWTSLIGSHLHKSWTESTVRKVAYVCMCEFWVSSFPDLNACPICCFPLWQTEMDTFG